MNTADRLDALIAKPPLTIPCPPLAVFFSDCHEGEGGYADDFAPNKELFLRVNQAYKESGFVRFFLGDTWERWQFSEVGPQKTVIEGEYFIRGNHDGDVDLPEAILLTGGSLPILLVHGHQGDWINDNRWGFSRWCVKYLWKALERIGCKDDWFSAALNPTRHDRVRTQLIEWANSRKVILIHGHIHRQEQIEHAWDVGCEIHPGRIETVELIEGELRLKTWENQK